MTDYILGILKQRDYWYHKWKKNKHNRYYLGNYKMLRNKSVAVIRIRKKEYYSRLIQHANGNTKKIWEIVKEVTGNTPKQQVLPQFIDRSIADNFNLYFTSVGPALAANFDNSTEYPFLAQPLTNTFYMYDIEPKDIEVFILNMSTNKATGPDRITVRLLKQNIDILLPI